MGHPLDDPVGNPPTGGHGSDIRNVLDSLIHGAPVRAHRADGVEPRGASTAEAGRRGAGSGRTPLPPSIADELTGLYDGAAWAAVLAAEDARWMRFRRPCQVVQLEVAGIAGLAERLGEVFAQRLLTLLAEILRDETRGSDLYARSARWRLQGVLPEQEPDRAPLIEERIRDRFRTRLGPELPLGLLIGIAAPTSTGGIAEALDTAGRAMRAGDVPPRDHAPAVTGVAPAPGRATDVRAGLVELGELHADGLITDDEYRAKRAEVLARL